MQLRTSFGTVARVDIAFLTGPRTARLQLCSMYYIEGPGLDAHTG